MALAGSLKALARFCNAVMAGVIREAMTVSLVESDWIRYKLVLDELDNWVVFASVMDREELDAKRRLPVVQRNLETLQRSASCVQSEAWRAELQSRLVKVRTVLQSLAERIA